jgi:taurine dioxygenase
LTTPSYRTIGVEPVSPVLGAVVDGVDLRAPLPADQGDELRDALARHLVLFFRDQDVTEEQQLTFASVFGPPVSASIDPDHELLFVTLEDGPESPPQSDRWHTDVPFVPEPPDVAVLSMRSEAPAGGDTLWASLYAAYDALSPVMQDLVRELQLELDLGTSAEAIRRLYGDERQRELLDRFRAVRQPLVRLHPVTRRPALFLCGSFMRGIVGMHPDESTMLLDFLLQRLDDPNLQCRWRWRRDDVAVWDERCTNHRGLSAHHPARRVVRRCLAGRGVPIPAIPAIPAIAAEHS